MNPPSTFLQHLHKRAAFHFTQLASPVHALLPKEYVTAASDFTWGKPNANASAIAAQNGDPTKIMIFGYDADAVMPGVTAPMRRVGFFLSNTNATSLNTNGGALFDAAVRWMTGFNANNTPVIYLLAPFIGTAGTAVTIKGANFGAAQGSSVITFNGRTATATAWSNYEIVTTVPPLVTSGPVVVTVNGVNSNGISFSLPAPIDADLDGMADSWEIAYFGNLSQGSSGDFDGDGLSNLIEFILGRNPTKGTIADNGIHVNLKVYTWLSIP